MGLVWVKCGSGWCWEEEIWDGEGLVWMMRWCNVGGAVAESGMHGVDKRKCLFSQCIYI